MKAIRLITTPISNTHADKSFVLNYRKEYLGMVEIIPEGITASQMGAAVKVAEKLRQASDNAMLFLEDSEWEYLKARAEGYKFQIVAAEIIEMVDAVKQAKDADSPHLKGEKKDKAASA